MTAIEFENVGKQYRLGLVSTGTISHDLNRWWTMNVLRKEDPYLKIGETNDRSHKGSSDYVWALKDINFKVEQGDVVGFIGKNGAGKSTLLKLLSRVTSPTTGCIKARGRIASLLEVGTGFHPEMTGRENIYMNGAIMGMTKQEISRKLDEIVDFSGCERYIDTPVKRYSSGMTVRLGFAIAAHLEPEILVVDEVLAVGDAEFQKKAIGKMKDVSQGGGRTVLFVSHNMAAVKNLCKKCVLLENGGVKMTGDAISVVSNYLNDADLLTRKVKWEIDPNLPICFTGMEIVNEGKSNCEIFNVNDNIKIIIEYYVKEDISNTNISFSLFKDAVMIFSSWDIENLPELYNNRPKGHYQMEITLPKNLLPGIYNTRIGCGRPNIGVICRRDDALQFELSSLMSESLLGSYNHAGFIKVNLNWKTL